MGATNRFQDILLMKLIQRNVFRLLLGVATLGIGASGLQSLRASDAAEKAAAIQTVPFNKLTPQASQKILTILEKPSLYRHVPAEVTDCDPDMYMHCLRSPEVVINIWQLMGITTVDAKRTSQFTWSGTDGAGTTGDVELIYGSDKLHIMYCDGYYEGTLLRRKINGKAVMLLQTTSAVGPDNRPLMSSQLDVFLQFENAGADLVAKTLAPLIASTADANFAETISFVGKISQASERNGPGMQNLANKLQNIRPEVRQEFARTAAAINQRAASRSTTNTRSASNEQSPEDLGLKPEVASAVPGSRTQ